MCRHFSCSNKKQPHYCTRYFAWLMKKLLRNLRSCRLVRCAVILLQLVYEHRRLSCCSRILVYMQRNYMVGGCRTAVICFIYLLPARRRVSGATRSPCLLKLVYETGGVVIYGRRNRPGEQKRVGEGSCVFCDHASSVHRRNPTGRNGTAV